MKSHKELIIGIFVVGVILGSFFLINYLRGSGLFQKYKDFYSTFESVEGLNPSSPVYISGYKAGTMKGITYIKDSRKYQVSYNVKGDFDIPRDSHCEIFSSDLLGGKALRIILGDSSEMLEDGDEMDCRIEKDMIGSLIGGIEPLKDQISTLITNLNETVTKVNGILSDETSASVRNIVSDVESSMQEIKSLTTQINSRTPQLTSIIENIDSISGKVNSSMENVDRITRELSEAQLKESVVSLKELLESLQDPQGSIGKLLSTDSLHNSIQTLTSDLDSLIKKIEKNPKKYLRISVF